MCDPRRVLPSLLLLVLAWRVSAPSDLFEGDQLKQVGYVMDLLTHGDWLLQYEINGNPATKPPLYNWCAAGFCKLFSSQAEWVIKLPALLAGCCWLSCLYVLGRRWFGAEAAAWSVVAALASHHFMKLCWFARTDMLLAAVVLGAITLSETLRPSWYRSPLLGLMAALAMLTKGPVGPSLIGIYLLLSFWQSGRRFRDIRVSAVLPGLAVLCLLTGTWLLLVWNAPGFQQRVVHWQLGTRMVESRYIDPWYYYLGHIFTRIAPWTFVAWFGAWRARKSPEQHAARHLVRWALAGLIFFSAIPFKRHDHLLPVYPPIFLLAGLGIRELLQLLQQRFAGISWAKGFGRLHSGAGEAAGKVQLQPVGVLLAAALICGHGLYYHAVYPQGRPSYRQVREFVHNLQQQVGSEEATIFQANPLIAYELRRHDRIATVAELQQRRPVWVVAPVYLHEQIMRETGWVMTPVLETRFTNRNDQAALYSVSRPLIAAHTSH